MREIIRFFSTQSQVEKVLVFYFLTLLVYMVVVFVLKILHKKTLGVFMLKYKDIFSSITYGILCVYLIMGCMVWQVVNNLLIYLGGMLAAAIIVNYLFILGYNLKKFKDFEFSAVTDTYAEITEYCETSDRIMKNMADFVSYIHCLDEDDISDMNFEAFCSNWVSCIQDYLNDRISSIEYDLLVKNKAKILNYIKDKNEKECLWHSDTILDRFADKLLEGEEVVLTNNIRIIPILSKRYTCYIYVKGNSDIKDFDKYFLVNTFSILSLL